MPIFNRKQTTNKIRRTVINTKRSFFSSFVDCNPLLTLIMKSQDSRISRVFMSNHVSSTVTVPKELAIKYGIEKPCYVTIQDNDNGILIKKLEVKK